MLRAYRVLALMLSDLYALFNCHKPISYFWKEGQQTLNATRVLQEVTKSLWTVGWTGPSCCQGQSRKHSGGEREKRWQLPRRRVSSPVFASGSDSKDSTCNAGDQSLSPRLGRSPGERKGFPFQYSGLENSKGCIVHGVTKSWTQLSDFHYIGPNKSVMWPREYIMMCVHSATNNLRCYITRQIHCFQNMGQESLTIAILANCSFPTTFKISNNCRFTGSCKEK